MRAAECLVLGVKQTEFAARQPTAYSQKRKSGDRRQHQPLRDVVGHGASLGQTGLAQSFQQMLPLSRPEGAALHYEALGKITLSAQ